MRFAGRVRDRGLRNGGNALGLLLVLLLVTILVVSPSCARREFGEDVEQRLESGLAKVMDKLHVPGAVVGVWIPGRGTWVEATGLADVEDEADMKRGYQFRIGSITKTFTTTVLLQLVEEEVLSLDDTLDDYLPEVPDSNRMTIRMLCNNTSGICDYNESEPFREELAKDPGRVWKPEELVEYAIECPPYFPPGESCRYSNTNFIIQGMIIEQLTGSSLAEEIEKRITMPLGLDETYLAVNKRFKGDHSRGYGGEGHDVTGCETVEFEGVTMPDMTSYYDPSVSWAAGGAVSTLDDMRVWAEALATGEGLLGEETQKERMTWVDFPDSNGVDRYGLGIWNMAGLIGHDGMFSGYNCDIFYYPPEEATIVVMMNLANVPQAGLAAVVILAEELFPGELEWE